MEINSEKYWENRFNTDWESNFGPAQTLFHYKTILENLPEWIKEIISNNKYSICDVGCGMGEGVNEFHNCFPESKIYGMDFSKYAIEKASKTFIEDNIYFFKGDILDFHPDFDIILSSHTLEHFNNPIEICENLSNYCKFLIISVPFREENLWKEHEFSFDYSSFPIYLNNKRLIYYKEIEPLFFKEGDYSINEQILVIYANELFIKDSTLVNMNSYYDDLLKLTSQYNRLKKNNNMLKKENEMLVNKINKYKKENEHFKSSKVYNLWKKYANFKDK